MGTKETATNIPHVPKENALTFQKIAEQAEAQRIVQSSGIVRPGPFKEDKKAHGQIRSNSAAVMIQGAIGSRRGQLPGYFAQERGEKCVRVTERDASRRDGVGIGRYREVSKGGRETKWKLAGAVEGRGTTTSRKHTQKICFFQIAVRRQEVYKGYVLQVANKKQNTTEIRQEEERGEGRECV